MSALDSLPGGDEIIEIVSLDDMLETLKPVSLMKVDVEGAELAVLAGAKKLIERDRPFLYVENDRPQTSRELISFISEPDYKFWWHIVPLFRPNNFAQTRQKHFGGVCSIKTPARRGNEIRNQLSAAGRRPGLPSGPADARHATLAMAAYWLGWRP